MSYFNELPNIQYLSRFANQSSNEDYTLAKNIFRRAKLREDIASAVTAFQYYQIRDNERPDQIAERVYGDAELDWVILITNNITDYISQWPLSNNDFYEYILDKYGSEDAFDDIKYYETIEVKDEYDRLVLPAKLQVDPDIYQQFTTIKNGGLFYKLKTFPIPSDYAPLEVTINLGEYLQVWERDNLGEGEEYKGVDYQVTGIKHKAKEDEPQIYPPYSILDYSNLIVHGRYEDKKVFILNTLHDWPDTWGGILAILNRDSSTTDISLLSNIGDPVDITDDFRLYSITTNEDKDTNTKKPLFRFISIGDEVINQPYPGVTVTISNLYVIDYLSTLGEVIRVKAPQEIVTNYEYESDENESYRKILILKPEFIGVFMSDMKNIMSYGNSSETIDKKTKKVYNSKIAGI